MITQVIFIHCTFDMVLSLQKRIRIVFLIQELHYSLRDAARAVEVPFSTVASFIQKYRRTGSLEPHYQAGSGRPSLISPHELRILKRQSTAAPRASASILASSIGGRFTEVSTRTVQRALNRIGRRAYRPTQGPHLSRQQRTVRLAWARAHLGWSSEAWERVSQIVVIYNLWFNHLRFNAIQYKVNSEYV
jgi:transposase